MIDIKERLTDTCPFSQAFEDKDHDGRPKAELGYIRADHDGYRWWNTIWPAYHNLETPDLLHEFDMVFESFIEAFPTREAMERYCMQHYEPVSSDHTEYNAYLDLEFGYYWLRMITRKGDYNLYLHCYSK